MLNDYQPHKLDGNDTNGALSLFTCTSEPGEGPPPHIHDLEDEIFYVLEGEYTFRNEDEALTGGPGSVVFAPRGHRHAWKNTGNTTGVLLAIATPPGLERFFMEIAYAGASPAVRPALDATEIRRLMYTAEEFELHILPPAKP